MPIKSNGNGAGNGPTVRPDPDPTVLTTQQLIRENTALKDYFQARFDSLATESILRQQLIEVRLDAMDKALSLVQAKADRLPKELDDRIAALREIHDEKFASIGVQFRERDVRTEQSSKDGKVAVDAALQAAKEAVAEQNRSAALAIAKSEAATAKQIDQMGLSILTGAKNMDDKFNDQKERLTRIEGKDEGSIKSTATQHTATSNASMIVGMIGAGVGVLVGVGGLLFAVMTKH